MFIALAFVCDDYFTASLDKICEVRCNIFKKSFLGKRRHCIFVRIFCAIPHIGLRLEPLNLTK